MMLLVMAGIVPVLVLIDVLLKSFVEMNVSRGSEHRIFHDRIIIRKVYNRGMFLNALEDRPGLVNILSLVSTGILTVYQGICLLLQKKRILKNLGLALMTAGGWSNTIDRWLRHYVIDYFSFPSKWKRLQNVTFNLGDMFLFVGSMLVFLGELFRKKK